MGFLVTLVTWDRKNHANIYKQFGAFTQCVLLDEKIHDLIILLPGNHYFFHYKDTESAAYFICFCDEQKNRCPCRKCNSGRRATTQPP